VPDIAAVGISEGVTSGMRDHATLLAQALEQDGVPCSLHWLARSERSLSASRAEVAAWARATAAELDAQRPDAVVLHYASFAYSYRGLPLHLAPVLSATRRRGRPLIALMHELAYPWRARELRANAWALSQRAALLALMRACSAAIVTTDFRVQWLRTRRWLPRRPLAFAPVYSNLPPPSAAVLPARAASLGLFGYAYEGAAVALVLDALTLLRERGIAAHLRLLGAPGPGSEIGELWAREARARDVGAQLSFSGALPAQDLSDELARCDVLLCAARLGPTSRKGTLAASLASGRPVVALDGPRSWSALVECDALRVVARDATALADGVAELLADEQEREALGARGRAFHEERMAAARTAELLEGVLDQVGV